MRSQTEIISFRSSMLASIHQMVIFSMLFIGCLYSICYKPTDYFNLTISSIRYERSSQTLVCTSIGGPATSVTWTRDNTHLVVDRTTYQHSQIITDTSTATYENRLTLVSKSSSLSGVYTCSVRSQRGNDIGSIEVSGQLVCTQKSVFHRDLTHDIANI